MKVWADADFAGRRSAMNSTSGGAVRLGCHTFKVWSRSHSVIALSSGEAELAAIDQASTEGLGVKALCADFEVMSDASAAIGIVAREGLGQVRHLAAPVLQVQQRAESWGYPLSES